MQRNDDSAPLGIECGKLFGCRGGDRAHLGLRGCESYGRPQPCDREVVASGIPAVAKRHEQIVAAARKREPRTHNTDDVVMGCIYRDSLAQDVRAPTKTTLPDFIRQYGDARSGGPAFVRSKRPA